MFDVYFSGRPQWRTERRHLPAKVREEIARRPRHQRDRPAREDGGLDEELDGPEGHQRRAGRRLAMTGMPARSAHAAFSPRPRRGS